MCRHVRLKCPRQLPKKSRLGYYTALYKHARAILKVQKLFKTLTIWVGAQNISLLPINTFQDPWKYWLQFHFIQLDKCSTNALSKFIHCWGWLCLNTPCLDFNTDKNPRIKSVDLAVVTVAQHYIKQSSVMLRSKGQGNTSNTPL
jgi:hypothetical protein